jgi:acid phosphatase type 7
LPSPNRRQFLQALAVAVASSAVSPAQNATLIRFPHVQNVKRNTVSVIWTVREPGAGAVDYWDATGRTGRATATFQSFSPDVTGMPFAYHRFEAVLSNLAQGTDYKYRVSMDEAPVTAEPLSFRTPGVLPFQFLAFGDSGTGSFEQRRISQLLLGHHAKFVIHTGDLVYPSGTFERYESLYFEHYRNIMKNVPFFPCPGNHDYYELNCIPYFAAHSLPQESIAPEDIGRYYSFDWANAHFVSLDSNDALRAAATASGKMLEWLDNDLGKTDRFWRIVYMHHPAYSAGKHSGSAECEMVRQFIVPILEKHHVPLVLSGHDHSYQRSYEIRGGTISEPGQGALYLTTGGGGAELHPVYASPFVNIAKSEHHYLACDVNGAEVQLKAIGLYGNEVDVATVAPAPVIYENGVLDSASYGRRLAAGGLVSLFGLQFAPEDISASQYPLPTTAGGVSVLLNGRALPILMASANQLNVQLPFDVAGVAPLTVKNQNGAATIEVTIEAVAPAIFEGAIFHQNGLQVTGETPAFPGEVLTIYLTGLGSPAEDVVAGEAARSVPLSVAVTVQVGDFRIPPVSARIAEGMAGVDIVTFELPSGVHGIVGLSVIAAGVQSNAVTLYTHVVQKREDSI